MSLSVCRMLCRLAVCLLLAPAVHAAEPPPIRIALIEGLSGPFGNAGEAVVRNIAWGIERVNQRGGVRLPSGPRPLELVRLDSQGSIEGALSMLQLAVDRDIHVVMQGNSSAVAAALVDGIARMNGRDASRRVVFLNYSAVDPSLTNEKCSFWHFRFDADADMRLDALTDALRDDAALKRVYLIGQDYSFGQYVVKRSAEMMAAKRPDVAIVGQELHPLGRIKDFLPYAAKIKASGAQAVITGNWGNDLTLLVKATRDLGLDLRYYTFYGNALGVPAALGDAGVGSVLAVAEWQPNAGGAASDAFYQRFRQRFPAARDDYVHVRMQAMVEMLAASIESAGSTDATAIARALEGRRFDGTALGGFHSGTMRADDHQFIQPLLVSVMDKAGTPGVRFDSEGSGYGFRTVRRVDAKAPPTICRMIRPD